MKVGKLYLLINRNRDYRNVFWLVEKRNKKKETKFGCLTLHSKTKKIKTVAFET